ncbi:NBS-LRR type resistance protein [Cucumis melo var. makuwa]|uniref:NBS-LRR type resistance protein n=1 Tax=Cucumis melo var. makuwa TaxID=1194695 RepID=A0A5A7TT40_CUCMM|nr:NBS-LRR type resistance protein [Cucumis melo var. makuwa]
MPLSLVHPQQYRWNIGVSQVYSVHHSDHHLTFCVTMNTLSVGPDVDSIMVERLVVRHVADNFIDDDALFLKFGDELKNARGSSSVGDNLESSQPLQLLGDVSSLDSWSWRAFFRARFQRSSNEASNVTSFKEFRGDYHRYFKKSNHGQTRLLDKTSLIIIVAGPSRFYNNSTSSLSNENQMLELQSQPTLEDSQQLFGDEICEIILAREFEDAKEMIERQQVKLEKVKCMIEEQRRTSELLTSQVEEMKKMVEGKIRTQKGP